MFENDKYQFDVILFCFLLDVDSYIEPQAIQKDDTIYATTKPVPVYMKLILKGTV